SPDGLMHAPDFGPTGRQEEELSISREVLFVVFVHAASSSALAPRKQLDHVLVESSALPRLTRRNESRSSKRHQIRARRATPVRATGSFQKRLEARLVGIVAERHPHTVLNRGLAVRAGAVADDHAFVAGVRGQAASEEALGKRADFLIR